jgi:hypothetical protein
MRAVAWVMLFWVALIAIPASGQCPGGQIIAIPVTLEGNTPILSAQINGIEARASYSTPAVPARCS